MRAKKAARRIDASSLSRCRDHSQLKTTLPELPDIIANRDKVVATFIDKARELIQLGADVILPMGITQCPVHIKPDWLMQELGVPVVEGIGAPIRFAAMLVSLKLNYSRKYWPKSGLVKK